MNDEYAALKGSWGGFAGRENTGRLKKTNVNAATKMETHLVLFFIFSPPYNRTHITIDDYKGMRFRWGLYLLFLCKCGDGLAQ